MFRFLVLTRLFDLAGSEAGGSGSGPVTPAPATSSPTAASTPATGSQTPTPPTGTQPPATTTPADDLQDGNWKELRTRYDTAKAELATLKAQANPAAAQVITQAQSLAKTLGYTDADFAASFSKDPLRTLQILQEESASQSQRSSQPADGQQGPDLNKQIEDAVNAKLTPIQEFQNRQSTEVAMTKYETTLTGLIQSDPILKEAPQEVVDIVKDYLGEYFSTQPEILLAMKTKHDFSAVEESLKFISGRMHGAFKAWLNKSNGGGQTTTAAQSPRAPGRLTLDQIIDDPSVLGSQYKG